MKVWLGYECVEPFGCIHRSLQKVFDCEAKALLWVEEVEETEFEWREYEEKEVE